MKFCGRDDLETIPPVLTSLSVSLEGWKRKCKNACPRTASKKVCGRVLERKLNRELYSVSCYRPQWKRIWKGCMCIYIYIYIFMCVCVCLCVCIYICVCVCVYLYENEKKVKVFVASHVWLFVTPWTVACQAPLSMGFPRQEYWSGLPFPSPGDLPDPGIEPRSPTLQADSLPLSYQGSLDTYA